MLRRIVAGAVGIAAGLALFVAPVSAATAPRVTVYRPPVTDAGAKVTIRAKATPGAYCSLTVQYILRTTKPKLVGTHGAPSWTIRVPVGTSPGDHLVTVGCSKNGKLTKRWTQLVITRTYFWEGNGDADFSTEWLRVPRGTFTVVVELRGGGEVRGLSAEWRTNGSKWDFFHTFGGYKRYVSTEGGAWGWLNITAYGEPDYWRVTMSGIAN
jgi:hypothetical protein